MSYAYRIWGNPLRPVPQLITIASGLATCCVAVQQPCWLQYYLSPLAGLQMGRYAPTPPSPYPPERWDAKGESEGKAAKLPAPLRAAQRKLIYGKGAPEGRRFHMKNKAAWAALLLNDGITIRIQGIRGVCWPLGQTDTPIKSWDWLTTANLSRYLERAHIARELWGTTT